MPQGQHYQFIFVSLCVSLSGLRGVLAFEQQQTVTLLQKVKIYAKSGVTAPQSSHTCVFVFFLYIL